MLASEPHICPMSSTVRLEASLTRISMEAQHKSAIAITIHLSLRHPIVLCVSMGKIYYNIITMNDFYTAIITNAQCISRSLLQTVHIAKALTTYQSFRNFRSFDGQHRVFNSHTIWGVQYVTDMCWMDSFFYAFLTSTALQYGLRPKPHAMILPTKGDRNFLFRVYSKAFVKYITINLFFIRCPNSLCYQ